MFRYIRDNVANPEIIKINYTDILEEEAIGMAFPIDFDFFNQNSPLYGEMACKIQNLKLLRNLR